MHVLWEAAAGRGSAFWGPTVFREERDQGLQDVGETGR